jgi:hypothetical protein
VNFHAVTYGPGLQAVFKFRVEQKYGLRYDERYDVSCRIDKISEVSGDCTRFVQAPKASDNFVENLLFAAMGVVFIFAVIALIASFKTAPVDDTSVSSNGRVYRFFSKKNSDFGDLEKLPELEKSKNLTLLMQHCDRLPSCMAFNTNGWFKYAVAPMKNWTDMSSAHRTEGLYWMQGGYVFFLSHELSRLLQPLSQRISRRTTSPQVSGPHRHAARPMPVAGIGCATRLREPSTKQV